MRKVDQGLVDDISEDVTDMLAQATRWRWEEDELTYNLAGRIFCSYRTATIIEWLRQNEYPLPRWHFQNHVVDFAAEKVAKKALAVRPAT